MLQSTFELKPSKFLFIFYASLHLGAVFISFWFIKPNSLRYALILFSIGSFLFILVRVGLLGVTNNIVKIACNSSNQWMLQNSKGRCWEAQLSGDSVNTLHFVLLNFKEKSKKLRRSLLIFPDAMEKADFRRLRIFLRHLKLEK